MKVMVQSQLMGSIIRSKQLPIRLKQAWRDGFLHNPLLNKKNLQNITLMVDLELVQYRKGDYCSAGTSTVAVDVLVSDCSIWIFSKSSFLKSRATLLTVGLGTPNSSTTLV